jgi:hypothetical protein
VALNFHLSESRAWWTATRATYAAEVWDKREREFLRLVDAEYARALAQGDEERSADLESDSVPKKQGTKNLTQGLLVGATIGAATVLIFDRLRKARQIRSHVLF